MKLEISRKEFLRSWQLVENFEDVKKPNGIFVAVSENGNVTLKATDFKMSVNCIAEGVNVLEAGQAVLPTTVFGSMLRKSDSDDLLLSVNSSKGLLKSGSNKTRFAVVPVENFPTLPLITNGKEVCEITSEAFNKLVFEATSAASQPTDFPKYMGTCNLRLREGLIEAASTDGKRLAISKCECITQASEDLLVPASSLQKISKLCSEGMVKIFADSSNVWFECEHKEFSIRRIDATFPKYEFILNDNKKTVLRVSRKELLKVIDRIDIIASTTPVHMMILQLNPNGEVQISAKSKETGTASEVLIANVEGASLQTGFNVKFFVDGLKVLSTDEAVIEFSGEDTQARMKQENFTYMIMPIRLTEQDIIVDGE